VREGDGKGGRRSVFGSAEREERICRELFDLRDHKVEEPYSRQVVKKCPSPVAPTILQIEPFGENVEGLSLCQTKTYFA